MKVIITGCAGFIGSNLADKLLEDGYRIIGIDNFNDYYDPKIKDQNLNLALKNTNFKLYREDILNFQKIEKIFKDEKPDIIVHLAARAGVRPSISNPLLYVKVNVLGTINLLKLSVKYKINKFIFGSSSSVYGNSPIIPFTENDNCNNIISPYGSSKRAAEFWVESFYRTYGLKSVILRFFTVYGPRGRVDMAPAIFTKAILEGNSINVFGDGSSLRDYTYIDDIVEGIKLSIQKKLNFEVINLGNNNPIKLTKFIGFIEKIIEKKAKIKKGQNQTGDTKKTHADIKKTSTLLNWYPKINIESGLIIYINWSKRNSVK